MDSRKLTAGNFSMAWVIFMFTFLFLCFSLTFVLSVRNNGCDDIFIYFISLSFAHIHTHPPSSCLSQMALF